MLAFCLADLHVGSSVGLWADGIYDEDGRELGFNKFQLWLVDRYQESLDRFRALRDEWIKGHPHDTVVGVVDGDLIQGSHDKDGQLTTPLLNLQQEAMVKVLRPFRELVDVLYVLHGTAWHGGKVSTHVRSGALQLDAKRHPNTKSPLWWELPLDMDGKLIHFTHHVSATSIIFYEASAPLRDYYLQDSEYRRMWGQNALMYDMVVRAHRHRAILIHKPPRIRVATLPCWQLKNEFGWKVGANTVPDIGHMVLMSDDIVGLQVDIKVYELPRAHIERPGEGENGRSNVHARRTA